MNIGKIKKCKVRTASYNWCKANNLEHMFDNGVSIFKFMGNWYTTLDFMYTGSIHAISLSVFAYIELIEIDTDGEFIKVRYCYN